MLAPERITLYCRQKDENGVYHAFPVDSANPNHDTAISWAKGDRWSWNKKDYDPSKEPIKFEFLNVDFDYVKIESLEVRGEGGRAYQVILGIGEDLFRVDLREDTLMDVIRNTGIQAGGRLNGSFCFVKDGSQTKLIREGTELHKRAIAEREKRETYTKNISRKDLKPGYQYETLNGHKEVFLGFVYAVSISKDTGEVSSPQKHMLFAKSTPPHIINFLRTGETRYSNANNQYRNASHYDFELTKSHAFKIEREKVLDNINLPLFVEHISKLAKSAYEERMGEKNYSRYFDSFKDPYLLSTMAVDKKDVSADVNEGKRILRKCEEYYRRW